MKVFTDAGTAITLTNQNFLAQGGEGQVFISGKRAYKIYLDQKKAINPTKIQELATLRDKPEIIHPLGSLRDSKKRVIGYEMNRVPKGAITLCEFSSRGYQKAEGITLGDVAKLADQLREGVSFIHRNRILVVDMNEMNFLLRKGIIYYIDVDSYQTPHFPATAIMEHVRDYQAKTWTEGSDWFSWGIITFQMFTGTHPFKGRHPDFGKRNLLERMQQSVSVFNRKAKLPRNCVPLDNLPGGYKAWAKAVFEDGKRVPPPAGLTISGPLPTFIAPVAKSTKSIEITTLQEELAHIRDLFSVGGFQVVITKSATIINRRSYPIAARWGAVGRVVIALDERQRVPISAAIVRGEVILQRLTDGSENRLGVDADLCFRCEGRLYIKTKQGAVLEVHSAANGKTYTTKVVANVMPRSTRVVGEGLLYEAFGQWFLVITPIEGQSYQLKIPELAKKKIITARYQKNVLMVTVSNKGTFSRHVFRIDGEYKTYDTWEEANVHPSALSFASLQTGICAVLNEDNKLELFQTKPGGIRKLINDDQAIPPGTQLLSMENNVVFKDGNTIKKVETR